MSWLPEGTALGELRIEETWVFYDGPRVFSCRSLTDQWYIAAWAEAGNDADRWLYMPVSATRLVMIRSGGLSLREAFGRPEALIYVTRLSHQEGDPHTAQPVSVDTLREEWLPGPDFRLDLPTQTLPPAEPVDALTVRARQEGRTRFRLEVAFNGYTRTEAPTRVVGEILLLSQNMFDNIGLALKEADPPQAGRIPQTVTEETASQVVELRAASFVIELAATRLDDLFGGSLFALTTKRLLVLLDFHLQEPDLRTELAQLRPRGAKSFRRFVTGLANTGGDVFIAAAGSDFAAGERRWSAERLQDFVRLLTSLVPDEQVTEIRSRMRLYRADLERRLFGLRDELAEVSYEGPIETQAFLQVDHAPINDVYDVLISAYAVLDEVVGETKVTYRLAQLSRITST
jgi:hypothetical protein